MAGMPGRSGGANRLAVAEHLARGTFRGDRHASRAGQTTSRRGQVDEAPVSPEARAATLRGLAGTARRMASALLDEFSGWDASSLHTLRSYALSSVRLEKLQADPM